jgi:hypothetical protein
VERRDAARGGARGGGTIQAASEIRTRVAVALASVALAAGIGAALVLTAGSYRLAVLGIVSGAVLLLCVALALPFPSLVPWPLVALAGAYALRLGGGDVDQSAPIYAGGLLAVAELAYWSVELRGRAHDAERLTERRATLIAALTLLSVAAGGLVLAATSIEIGSGIAIDLLGVAAAVGSLAVVAALARSRREQD